MKPDWIWKQDGELFDRLEGIQSLAAEAGLSMTQYSLASLLTLPAMTSLIVGITSQEQIQDAVAAAEVTIPTDHRARLDAICPPPWRQPNPIR